METSDIISEAATLKELNIHVAYIREKMNTNNSERKSDMLEIKTRLKELVDSSPSRIEFDDLRRDVNKSEVILERQVNLTEALRGDRKWAIGAITILIFLQGALILLARLYIENVVRTTLSAYDIKVN